MMGADSLKRIIQGSNKGIAKWKKQFVGIVLIALSLMYIRQGVFFAEGIQEASNRFFGHVVQYEIMYFLFICGSMLATRDILIKGRPYLYFTALGLLMPLLLLNEFAITQRNRIIMILAIGISALASLILICLSLLYFDIPDSSVYFILSLLFSINFTISLHIGLKFSQYLFPEMSMNFQNPVLIAVTLTWTATIICTSCLYLPMATEETKLAFNSVRDGMGILASVFTAYEWGRRTRALRAY